MNGPKFLSICEMNGENKLIHEPIFIFVFLFAINYKRFHVLYLTLQITIFLPTKNNIPRNYRLLKSKKYTTQDVLAKTPRLNILRKYRDSEIVM